MPDLDKMLEDGGKNMPRPQPIVRSKEVEEHIEKVQKMVDLTPEYFTKMKNILFQVEVLNQKDSLRVENFEDIPFPKEYPIDWHNMPDFPKPPEKIEITNPQKEVEVVRGRVEITNLPEPVREVTVRNMPDPVREVTVKNLRDVKIPPPVEFPKKLEVSNLSEISTLLRVILGAIQAIPQAEYPDHMDVTVSNPIIPPRVVEAKTVGGVLVKSANKTVTTAGTAVQLDSGTPCHTVIVQAKTTNTGKIYVGLNGVSSTTGYELEAGNSVVYAVDDANQLFINSSVSGEKVTYQVIVNRNA